MRKRIVATVLALCLVLGLVPGTAWAAEGNSAEAIEAPNVWGEDSVAYDLEVAEYNLQINPDADANLETTLAEDADYPVVFAESALSGSCGTNLTWSIENSTLTISGTGRMTNYSDINSKHSPWYDSRRRV